MWSLKKTVETLHPQSTNTPPQWASCQQQKECSVPFYAHVLFIALVPFHVFSCILEFFTLCWIYSVCTFKLSLCYIPYIHQYRCSNRIIVYVIYTITVLCSVSSCQSSENPTTDAAGTYSSQATTKSVTPSPSIAHPTFSGNQDRHYH